MRAFATFTDVETGGVCCIDLNTIFAARHGTTYVQGKDEVPCTYIHCTPKDEGYGFTFIVRETVATVLARLNGNDYEPPSVELYPEWQKV